MTSGEVGSRARSAARSNECPVWGDLRATRATTPLKARYSTTATRRRRRNSPEILPAPDRPSILSAAQPVSPSTIITTEAISRRFIAPPPSADTATQGGSKTHTNEQNRRISGG